MEQYPELKFDKLQAFLNLPYTIDLEDVRGVININVPYIYDVAIYGEVEFYSTINIFVNNTTSNRLILWDYGIDWNEISDFQMFILFYRMVNDDIAKLLFKTKDGEDIIFSKFERYDKIIDEEGNTETVLYNQEQDIEINEDVYQHIHQYLGFVFNMKPENKFTDDNVLKQWWIKKDRRELEQRKNKEFKSVLLPIMSSLINHSGFKYNLEDLKKVGVCQFYDAIERINVYEQSISCLRGMYSGMVDSSKIKPESYNWMRELK